MSAIEVELLHVGGDDWQERLNAEHNVAFSLNALTEVELELPRFHGHR